MNNEIVKFVPESLVRNQVHEAFLNHSKMLATLLPAADIQHIGSTAVPKSLTKGDLDLQVRVLANQFKIADQILAQHFERNLDSTHTEVFSSFKDDTLAIPLGIQLTVIESESDFFWKIRDLMLQDSSLVEAYNQIKRKFEGRAMEAYRMAKSEFLEGLMNLDAFRRL